MNINTNPSAKEIKEQPLLDDKQAEEHIKVMNEIAEKIQNVLLKLK